MLAFSKAISCNLRAHTHQLASCSAAVQPMRLQQSALRVCASAALRANQKAIIKLHVVACAASTDVLDQGEVSSALTLAPPAVRHQPKLDNKQTKEIKSRANGLAANKKLIKINMGKRGVTDNFVVDSMRALRAHEVIRISVTDGADMDREEAAEVLCTMLDCVCVQAMGNCITLYRDQRLPMPSNIQDAAAEAAGKQNRRS